MLMILVVTAVPSRQTSAYNCGGRTFQPITVTPSSQIAGGLSDFVIDSAVPSLNGCDLTTATLVSVLFQPDSNVATISGGSVNGVPIESFTGMAGQTVAFVCPLSVANGMPLNIVLRNVTNASSAGSKTVVMSASPVENGSIGNTVSSAYSLVQPTPTNTLTLTATATVTPTATRTATPTGTATFTATRTPSPTTTASPTPGQCTGSAGQNPCARGGGPRSSDCYLEWVTRPAALPDRSGMPRNKLTCYEGDPSCDDDADLNNGLCRFRVRLCINNADPRLAQCTATDVKVFEVKHPRPDKLGDLADARNLAALEGAAGAAGLGVTVARGEFQLSSGSASSHADACSAFFPLDVPLRTHGALRASAGKKRFRVKATSSSGKADVDSLSLQCRPSTCGDGVVQRDHETCDDGNRSNGDGCDQGCHSEPPR